ncbi:SRPBCC domain-containing protein [Streptomyces axinellae]|uniref:SRPBCC domain-containing protein n=1 Tax=Streptomyces axinellae TaxID=552788 RepID=A0ABP6CR94_9ACTN
MSTDSQAPSQSYGIPYGTARSSPGGDAHTISFELAFPRPVETVWEAVATPEGLRSWLASAHPFEPGPGGAVALRWLDGGEDAGSGPGAGATSGPDAGAGGAAAAGRITAWSRRRLAEYTVGNRGSFGFTLKGTADDDRTRVRFRNDFTGDAACLLDRLAGWHHHFELLKEELEGRAGPPGHSSPAGVWAPDRFSALRAEYAGRLP